MKNNILIKFVPILPALFLTGCIIVFPGPQPEPDCVNPEGPWYSCGYLDENPERISDIYRCSNYWEWEENKNKPITGSADFFLGEGDHDCSEDDPKDHD